MLLKLQLTDQYKIKYIYLYMCSSGSQAQDLGGGWRESFLGMYCYHDSGTCPSDLAALNFTVANS